MVSREVEISNMPFSWSSPLAAVTNLHINPERISELITTLRKYGNAEPVGVGSHHQL